MWRVFRRPDDARAAALIASTLAVAAIVVVPAASASRTAQPRATSSAGGISYHPTAAFPHNVMSFSFGPDSGTISILNSTGGPRIGASYQVTVKCAKFLPNGIVYWGGPVSRSAPGSFNEKGRWVFGYFKAGGRRQGRVAGEFATTGTCYTGANKVLAGPSFPVVSGVIRVS